MRNILLAIVLAVPLSALAAVPETVTLDVQNMTCPLCPITVRKSLEKVAGVQLVEVNFANKTVTVSYDPDKAKPAALIRATTGAGYPSMVDAKEPTHGTP